MNSSLFDEVFQAIDIVCAAYIKTIIMPTPHLQEMFGIVGSIKYLTTFIIRNDLIIFTVCDQNRAVDRLNIFYGVIFEVGEPAYR